jgi:hypothetical protein
VSRRRASEPDPPEWLSGHAWTTTLSLRLVWADERWQVAADPAPTRDPVGTVCTHGLHLTEPPDVRHRCEAIARRLDDAPVPSPMQLARQLAALGGLVLTEPED